MSSWALPVPWGARVAPPEPEVGIDERSDRTDRPVATSASLFGARQRMILWLGLLLGSLSIVILPNMPIAAPVPLLAVAVATMVGAVGLAVVHLSTLRYVYLGKPLDLFVAAAFWTLALGTVSVRLVAAITRPEIEQIDVYVGVLELSRALAAGFFLAGIASIGQVIPPAGRVRYATRFAIAVAGIIVLGVGGVVALRGTPPAVDEQGRLLIEAGAVVSDMLGGQAAWLITANGVITILFLLATIGYMRHADRLGDPHFRWLAVALTLLTFSQFHSLLFPPVSADYVSTSDGLRLAAYVALLYGLVARIGGEIGERMASQERLRLSRELHDGLAQQLSLLHLRLGRAVEPDRPADRRLRDIEAAQRLAQAAMLEARQAINALRAGTVTWRELVRAVSTFADEFEQNHEVTVHVAAQTAAPRRRTFASLVAPNVELGAGVQAEVMRILHEACSNAVQHGGATELDITLFAGADDLMVRIGDNGCGFDPAALAAQPGGGSGIGLLSLQERVERCGGSFALDARPGTGVTLQVHMPLTGRRDE